MKLLINKISDDAVIPSYSKKDDCGLDLSSIDNYTILKGERAMISTGIKMKIPSGFFGSIRDRSGLAVKNGIHVLAGVVDSGYIGEIKIILINLGSETFHINKGDRVAQIIIQPYLNCDIEEVLEISENTQRGEDGFGSSGK